MNITTHSARNSSLIDDRYEIIKKLGEGGYGEVFLVKDYKLGKEWAMKKINAVDDNEIHALKTIESDFFPRIVDIITYDMYSYLIMDYIHGRTLEDILNTEDLSSDEIIRYSLSICEGIESLHLMNPPMLYLDCKPSNIIIDSLGNLRFVDVGSIYVCSQKNVGRLSGTEYFASPEQKLCGDVDIRSDIYSIGMTMYRMIVRSKTEYRDSKGHLDTSMAGNRIGKKLAPIISKATENNPQKRYQTISEMKKSLLQVSHHSLSISRIVSDCIPVFRYFAQTLFAMFTILSYYVYSVYLEPAYIILGSALFILLICICDSDSRRKIKCIEDIYRGVGKRILYGLLLGISIWSLIQCDIHANSDLPPATGLPKYCGGSTMIQIGEISREITILNEYGYPCLYSGQKLYSDGTDIYVSIPCGSISPDEMPSSFIVK